MEKYNNIDREINLLWIVMGIGMILTSIICGSLINEVGQLKEK